MKSKITIVLGLVLVLPILALMLAGKEKASCELSSKIEEVSKRTMANGYYTQYSFFVPKEVSKEEIKNHAKCLASKEDSQAFSLRYYDTKKNTPDLNSRPTVEFTDSEVNSQILNYSVNKKTDHKQGIWTKKEYFINGEDTFK